MATGLLALCGVKPRQRQRQPYGEVTMYQDIKPRILEALRHGPLTLPELAEQLGEAEYLVRAELKALRRDRLVTDELGQERIDWRLTDLGAKRANFADQMRLA